MVVIADGNTRATVASGRQLCTALQNTASVSSNAITAAEDAVVNRFDFRRTINIESMDINGKLLSVIVVSFNGGTFRNRELAKIAAKTAFSCAAFRVVVANIYNGRFRNCNIGRVGSDTIVVALRRRQGRMIT